MIISNHKRNILLTGIGGDIAESISYLIKENFPNFRIIGADINLLNSGKLYSDRIYKVPLPNSLGYLKKIKEIIKKEKINYCIPTNENEIFKFSDNLKNFKQIKIIILDAKIISISRDRYSVCKELKKIGVQTPWTILSSKKFPTNFPFIYKNRMKSDPKIFKVINNARDLKSIKVLNEKSIFQEILPSSKKDVTCSIYRDRNGNISSIAFLKNSSESYTNWVKLLVDKKIDNICKKIAKKFDLRGSMNIQLILTKEGAVVKEINARFSSTVMIRHLFGFKDFVWTLYESEKSKVNLKKTFKSGTLIKYSNDIIYKI